jgi:hypothetical protein
MFYLLVGLVEILYHSCALFAQNVDMIYPLFSARQTSISYVKYECFPDRDS